MAVNLQVHKGQQANQRDDGEMNPQPGLLFARNGQPAGSSAVDEPMDVTMQQLAAAAEQAAAAGNESIFLVAKQQIDWQRRPADDFSRAIRWALAAGAYLAARNLATQGAEHYPDHQELQKFAYLLAPPKVIQRDLPPDPTVRANHEWLRTNRLQFRGQWVALRNGQLLAAANALQELTEQFGITPDILYTKVF